MGRSLEVADRVSAARVRTSAPRVWPLALVAAAGVALSAAGAVPRWPGLPHLAGLPPLDLYTDLRILLVGTDSWPSFTLLLVVVLALRIVVLALLLGGLDRHRIAFAATVYLLALLPLAAAAQLTYLGFTVLYSRLFWVAIGVAALVVLLLGAAPWQGTTRMRTALRRSGHAGLRAGTLCGYLAVVAVLSVVAQAAPAATTALIPVSALVTAVTVRLLARPPRPRALLRLAALAGAAVLAAMGALVATRDSAPDVASARPGSLLLMSGINSSPGDGAVFTVDPRALGFRCDQVYYFSYAGPGDGVPGASARCPIRTGAPFGPPHTHRAVAELARVFAAQIRELPRPLVVVGHSNSAWVAWFAVSRGMAPEVDVLVLLGAFGESTHGYRDAGEQAPGRVASDVLRLLAPLASRFGFTFAVEAPVFRAVLGDAEAPGRIMGAPLPSEVRSMSALAASDLPLLPSGWRLAVDYNACPVWRAPPWLPTSRAVWTEINRFLDGAPPPRCGPVAEWVATLARPFGVPPELPAP